MLAFADDGRIGRWTDGRQVEEVTAPTLPGSLSMSRGPQSDLGDGPSGAAFAGLGAMIGYSRDDRNRTTRENYLLDLSPGTFGVPLRITGLLRGTRRQCVPGSRRRPPRDGEHRPAAHVRLVGKPDNRDTRPG